MLTEVIRIIITLALAVSAAYLAKSVPQAYVPQDYAIILYIIIGTGLGYVLGGVVGRRIDKLVKWIEEKTKKISSYGLVTGISGLILGLIIASLVSKPIEEALKPLGLKAAPYAITLIYFVLGYLGFSLFVHRQFDLDVLSTSKNISAQNENVLDTSILIDGRIANILTTGFLQGTFLLPRFVLAELQTIADSSNSIRRAKGRRGLEILQQLRKHKDLKIEIIENDFPTLYEVDDKLVKLCKERGARLVTNDYNLAKIATIDNIQTLNINNLASSLKPAFISGESFTITITKAGKEKDQGVGYLDDGTMVIIENGKNKVGKEVEVVVNSVLQTTSGKLIFTKTTK